MPIIESVILTTDVQKILLKANGWNRTEYHPKGKENWPPYEYWMKNEVFVCVMLKKNQLEIILDQEEVDADTVQEFVFLFKSIV